jgi:hypothetical protein
MNAYETNPPVVFDLRTVKEDAALSGHRRAVRFRTVSEQRESELLALRPGTKVTTTHSSIVFPSRWLDLCSAADGLVLKANRERDSQQHAAGRSDDSPQ